MSVNGRGLSIASLSFGIALFGLGLAREWQASHSLERRTVEASEPIKFLGDLPPRKEQEFTILLQNFLEQKVTILGSPGICRDRCCIYVLGLPVEIPASGQMPIRIQLFTRELSGDFEYPVTLYTNIEGIGEVTVNIRGRVLSIDAPVNARLTAF